MIIDMLNILSMNSDCSLLGVKFQELLDDVFGWIQLAVPVLVVLLCSFDIAKAVIAQNEKDMQIARTTAIKRIIIGIVIFLCMVGK